VDEAEASPADDVGGGARLHVGGGAGFAGEGAREGETTAGGWNEQGWRAVPLGINVERRAGGIARDAV